MSIKELIFQTISDMELNIPVSYGFSDDTDFPKIVYFHVHTTEKRLSDKRKIKHHVYQLNFYDLVPHDLDSSEILQKIQNSLDDTKLNTGSWQEVIGVDADRKETQFMYFLEIYS
jgi:hypothetical protein